MIIFEYNYNYKMIFSNNDLKKIKPKILLLPNNI